MGQAHNQGGERAMKYLAELKYSKTWTMEIEANSLEEAEGIAQASADYQDQAMDINERECVTLVGVEKGEDNE